MARPIKSGLDYFPLDVDFFSDDKIEYITARFDEKGELVAIKLLCSIYREGYYTDWNEDKATIFSKRAGRNITPSLANDVVNELVKRGFFDGSIFNSFGILTSRGIQKRFLKAVADRKVIEIVEKYWLLNIPQDTKTTVFVVQNEEEIINSPVNPVNHPVNPVKPPGNTQSKVNKSKVNNPPIIPPEKQKIKFAEFVSMTNDEYLSLITKLGEHGVKRCVEILDNYKGSKGKKYKSDYRAILSWVIDRFNEENQKKTAFSANNRAVKEWEEANGSLDDLF